MRAERVGNRKGREAAEMTVNPPRMRRPARAVRVGSTSYGRGVFARRRFRSREVIGEIRGTVIDDPNYESDYCMDIGSSLVLEPDAPFRYVNHSCEPNCRLVAVTEWDERAATVRRTLFLTSLATIGPGEQLTIDYAWPAPCAVPCACGSAACRGWIVSRDELGDIAMFQHTRSLDGESGLADARRTHSL
jgi:uncharacterized protein